MKILQLLILNYWFHNCLSTLCIICPCLLTLFIKQGSFFPFQFSEIIIENIINISLSLVLFISQNINITLPIATLMTLKKLNNNQILQLLFINNITYKNIINIIGLTSLGMICITIPINNFLISKNQTTFKKSLEKNPLPFILSHIKKKRTLKYNNYTIYSKNIFPHHLYPLILSSPKNHIIAQEGVINYSQNKLTLTLTLNKVISMNKNKAWTYNKKITFKKDTNSLKNWDPLNIKNLPKIYKKENTLYHILHNYYPSINWEIATLIILTLFPLFFYKITAWFIILSIIFTLIPFEIQRIILNQKSNHSLTLIDYLPTLMHFFILIMLTIFNNFIQNRLLFFPNKRRTTS